VKPFDWIVVIIFVLFLVRLINSARIMGTPEYEATKIIYPSKLDKFHKSTAKDFLFVTIAALILALRLFG
jgi:hypothetical protein